MSKEHNIKKQFRDISVKFVLNTTNSSLMVNATEMAKIFGREVRVFLKSDETNRFIEAMKKLPKDELLWNDRAPGSANWGVKTDENSGDRAPNSARSGAFFLTEDDIIQRKGPQGLWMHRLLALRFAAWLDAEFELWIYITIDQILFGHYKEHWEAHAMQEEAKEKMNIIKSKLLLKGGKPETFAEYFENLEISKKAGLIKSKAIRSQLKIFGLFEDVQE